MLQLVKHLNQGITAILFILLSFISYTQTTTTFSTPGTFTWTVPPCVTSITVDAWGAGGGGGGAWVKMDNSTTDVFGTAIEACAGGGGGGGGGFSRQTYAVVPGQTYTIVVGAGGIGGVSATTPLNNTAVQNGGNGGASTFSGNTYSLTAGGGNGGVKAYSYNSGFPSAHLRTGGAGGTGGVGTLFNGGNGSGGSGGSSFDFSGAGGGGAGTTSPGGAANATTIPHTGGTGGAVGGGAGANGFNLISGTHNGAAGNAIGGAGAGGVSHTTGYCNPAKVAQGGAGARGEVRITYTTSGTAAAQPSAITGPTSLCGTAGTYSVTNDPSVTYSWTYSGTGTITGTGNSISLSATTGGTLTVTPANGCGNGPSQSFTISMGAVPAQPSAITGPASLCGSGGTYSVTNDPTATYTWTYSGTGTITGAGNSISLAATTGGTLTVTPSNACGNGPAQTFPITIGTAPSQPSVISGPPSLCATAGTYSVTNVAGVTYTWTYSGTGTITGAGNSISLAATTGGTLTVTPSNACGNGPAQTYPITIGTAPSQPSVISGPSSLCATAGTYSVTNVAGVTYTWTYSGTGTITGAGNSISLAATTGGTLTVTPSNACGNGPAQTMNIALSSPIVATLDYTTNETCDGLNNGTAGILVSGGVAPFSYSWTPSGLNSPNLTNLSPGSYLATVTDNNGCTGTIGFTISAAPAFTTTVTGTPADCGISNGTATVSSFGGVGTINYQWNPGGQNTTTITNLSSGTYTAVVTDANNCVSTSSYTVALSGTLNIQVTPPLSVINLGESVNLAASIDPSVIGETYQWTPVNGLSCTACSNPSATPSQTTTYIVTVTLPDGCSDTASALVQINTVCGEVYIPDSFSPNNDGHNDFFRVYGNCIMTFNLRVYDRWGEMVFDTDKAQNGWDGTFRDKELNSGVYVYKVNITLVDGTEVKESGNLHLIR